MTAIGQYLSPLLLSKMVWANLLRTIQGLDIGAPQVDVDLIILCGDDARTRVGAV